MSWDFHHVQIFRPGLQTVRTQGGKHGLCQLPSYLLTHLHGNFPNGPGSVVTHRNKLRVQIQAEDGHKLSWQQYPQKNNFNTHPDISGVTSSEKHSPMQGLTCRKQTFVKSPRRAKELCLTSGIVSCNTYKHLIRSLLKAESV